MLVGDSKFTFASHETSVLLPPPGQYRLVVELIPLADLALAVDQRDCLGRSALSTTGDFRI